MIEVEGARTGTGSRMPPDGTLLEERATLMFTEHPDPPLAATENLLLAGLPAAELEPLLKRLIGD